MAQRACNVLPVVARSSYSTKPQPPIAVAWFTNVGVFLSFSPFQRFPECDALEKENQGEEPVVAGDDFLLGSENIYRTRDPLIANRLI